MEKTITLYEMTSDLIELMDAEINEEVKAEIIEAIKLQIETKAENIIAVIRNYETRIEAVKAEEKRLADMRKIGEARLEKFKKYVKENMEALELQKIQTELGTLSIAKNPLSVEVIELNKVPQEFLKQEIKISADKTAIKEHFKETGEVPEGCIIYTDRTSLRIK